MLIFSLIKYQSKKKKIRFKFDILCELVHSVPLHHPWRERHLQIDPHQSKIDFSHLPKTSSFPLTLTNPCMISLTRQSTLNTKLFLPLFSSPPLIPTSTPWCGWYYCLPGQSISQFIKLIQAKNNIRQGELRCSAAFYPLARPAT